MDSALLGLGARAFPVADSRFHDLVHQLVRRVEGCGRRLRDVADFAAAQLAYAVLAVLQDVASVEDDLAAGDADAAAAIAHRGQADGGLAGAGFADQSQHLSPFKGQRDIIDDDDIARLFAWGKDARLDAEIADLEQRLLRRRLNDLPGQGFSHCRALP
jgi:hypothetical protein